MDAEILLVSVHMWMKSIFDDTLRQLIDLLNLIFEWHNFMVISLFPLSCAVGSEHRRWGPGW